MKDQVAAITSMGIAATCISDKELTAYSTKKAVQEGRMQVILISPEALFCGTEWRRLLCTDVYRHNLVAFVVDEAHCIKEWYVFLYCLSVIFEWSFLTLVKFEVLFQRMFM